MKLQVNEKIIKVYHHHKFFFIWRGIKIWAAALPFFLVAFIFSPLTGIQIYWWANMTIVAIFALIHGYDFLMYYLDTLVITNQRLVHLDWVNPLRYTETQAMLNDIQNIESSENGFLSKFKIFDFGLFLVETASTRTVINFPEAPDPEGIKFFLTNLSRRHFGVAVANNKQGVTSSESYIAKKKEVASDSKVVAD